jgi:hypothetical protein
MKRIFQTYATPLTTGLFLISLISGIALFVYVGQGTFRGMHEWLSMVLIAPFLLHLWKNWRPMTNYLKNSKSLAALLLMFVIALPFAMGSSSEGRTGGPPQFALARSLLSKPMEIIAPALGTTPAAITDALQKAGIPAPQTDRSLSDLAKAAGKDDMAVAAILASVAH